MEFLMIVFYLLLGLGILFVYGMISVAIVNKFISSQGFSKLFWFFVMIGMLSFLFGNSDTINTENSFGGGGEDHFFHDDEYDSCDYFTNWECDDD